MKKLRENIFVLSFNVLKDKGVNSKLKKLEEIFWAWGKQIFGLHNFFSRNKRANFLRVQLCFFGKKRTDIYFTGRKVNIIN